LLPGNTIKTLVPRAAICARIVDLAPSPIATMAITAPTPIMMPSMVKKARSLLRANALRAILNVMSPCITAPLERAPGHCADRRPRHHHETRFVASHVRRCRFHALRESPRYAGLY